MKKELFLGNLNITFGKRKEPLLNYFEEIILPVLKNEEKKYPKIDDKENYFQIKNIEIIEVKGEIVLVGIFLHKKMHKRNFDINNNQIVKKPGEMSGVYVSKFYLFLKNHRIALIKDENQSPNLKNLQSHVKRLLINNRIIKKKENIKIPFASVEIINIPTDKNIENLIKSLDSISEVRFKFIDTNGLIEDTGLLCENGNDIKSETNSKWAYFTLIAPKNINNLVKVFINAKPYVMKRILGKKDGKDVKLEENDFTTKEYIETEEDRISDEHHENIIENILEYSEMKYVDSENLSNYNNKIIDLRKYIDKKSSDLNDKKDKSKKI